MIVSFCISGQGRLATLAMRHAGLLHFEVGSVLLDVRASTTTEVALVEAGIEVTRLRHSVVDDVNRQIAQFFDLSESDIWVLTFDRLLSSAVVTPRRGRILNVHLALLPACRGLNGFGRTLRSGARFGGATIHEIDEQMDEGNIVSQFVAEVLPGDTVETLGDRVFQGLAPMFAQTLSWYAQGRIMRDADSRPHVRDGQFLGGPISPYLEFEGREFASRTGLGLNLI